MRPCTENREGRGEPHWPEGESRGGKTNRHATDHKYKNPTAKAGGSAQEGYERENSRGRRGQGQGNKKEQFRI